MPAKFEFELKINDNMRHGYYMSTMLHGVLMTLLDASYADKLHTNHMHPYSQYVSFEKDKKDRMFWHIQTLNDEAEQAFRSAFFDPSLNELYLEHRDETLQIMGKRYEAVSEEKLLDQYYFGKCDPFLKLRFCTPTSFKQNDHYVIFPSVRLIFQSLMLRHDAGSDKHTVYAKDILEDFENYASIAGYRLKSAYFHTDHVKIPGFLGEVTIRINGPQQMINFAWFLAAYGAYSGIGVKTGLGMGGMTLLQKEGEK